MQSSTNHSENKQPVFLVQVIDEKAVVDTVNDVASTPQANNVAKRPTWFYALKKVLPLYIVTHVLFLLLTYLSVLFVVANYSKNSVSFSTLVKSWYKWDSVHFTAIATYGYDGAWRTAFFPLFPLLERVGLLLIHHVFLAGLIISNSAALVLFAVLYRLIEEDFDQEHAYRTTLFLAVFPTAFFFATGLERRYRGSPLRVTLDVLDVAQEVYAIVRHLEGKQPCLDLPLDVQATAFQQRVWNELRAIPYGETRSYREVAQALGDPKKAMQDLKNRSDAELERAIKAAQAKGAKVTRDDWVFPNWDPMKYYTDADYAALKK